MGFSRQILEWVVMPSSRETSQPRNQIHISYISLYWQADSLPLVPPGAFLAARTVRNKPAIQETQVWSLDWEDPLGEEMDTHSRILAWRIPWTEEPGRLQSTGSQRV